VINPIIAIVEGCRSDWLTTSDGASCVVTSGSRVQEQESHCVVEVLRSINKSMQSIIPVYIVTRLLTGQLGFDSWQGRALPPALGPSQPAVQWILGFFLGR
jgi:hypothetical protein